MKYSKYALKICQVYKFPKSNLAYDKIRLIWLSIIIISYIARCSEHKKYVIPVTIYLKIVCLRIIVIRGNRREFGNLNRHRLLHRTEIVSIHRACKFVNLFYSSLLISVSAEPPSLTVKPRPQQAKSNSVASFYCGARGDPRPTIYWRKNLKKVSTSLSRYEIVDKVVGDSETGSVLRIEPTRAPRDNAVYECFAENGVGDAVSANAKLEVYDGK